MNEFADFIKLPPSPPTAPVENPDISTLEEKGGGGGSNVNPYEENTLAHFLPGDTHTWSCLGNTGTRVNLCVKHLLIWE